MRLGASPSRSVRLNHAYHPHGAEEFGALEAFDSAAEAKVVECEDVERLSSAHHGMFLIPPREERAYLERGRVCYVLVKPSSESISGELLPIQLMKVTGDDGTPEYVGALLETPMAVKSISRGDYITFGAQNVARIAVTRAAEVWYNVDAMALATKRVLVEDLPVMIAQTSRPSSAEDSGLRIFSGVGEGIAYVNDMSNFGLISIREAVRRCPALERLILSQPVHLGYSCASCGQGSFIVGRRYTCEGCNRSFCERCCALEMERQSGDSTEESEPKRRKTKEADTSGTTAGTSTFDHVCAFHLFERAETSVTYRRASRNELFEPNLVPPQVPTQSEMIQRDGNPRSPASRRSWTHHLSRRDARQYMPRMVFFGASAALRGIAGDVCGDRGFGMCPIITNDRVRLCYTVGLGFTFSIPEIVVRGNLHPPVFTLLAAEWLSMHDSARGRNEEFPCYPRFPEQLSDSFLQLLSELSGSPIPMDDPSFSSVTYRPLANGDPDMESLGTLVVFYATVMQQSALDVDIIEIQLSDAFMEHFQCQLGQQDLRCVGEAATLRRSGDGDRNE